MGMVLGGVQRERTLNHTESRAGSPLSSFNLFGDVKEEISVWYLCVFNTSHLPVSLFNKEKQISTS